MKKVRLVNQETAKRRVSNWTVIKGKENFLNKISQITATLLNTKEVKIPWLTGLCDWILSLIENLVLTAANEISWVDRP